MTHDLVRLSTSRRRSPANACQALCTCGHKSFGRYRLDALDAHLHHVVSSATQAMLDAWVAADDIVPCGDAECGVCGGAE